MSLSLGLAYACHVHMCVFHFVRRSVVSPLLHFCGALWALWCRIKVLSGPAFVLHLWEGGGDSFLLCSLFHSFKQVFGHMGLEWNHWLIIVQEKIRGGKVQ